MTWHERAACRGSDFEIFFRQRRSSGQPGRGETFEWDDAEAKAVCAVCTVTAECLADGERSKDFGVWGGLNPDERRARRKARVGNKAASPALEQAMAEAREARRGRGRVE